MKKISAVVIGISLAMGAAVANATPWIDVSSVDVETGPVATLALTVLGALAAIWVVRKLIKLTNRS